MSDPRCICDGSGCCFETCEPCVKDALAERDRLWMAASAFLSVVTLTARHQFEDTPAERILRAALQDSKETE